MDRILRLFKARSFAFLLFHIGILLFSWPLISITASEGGEALFWYLIGAWAAMVILLGVVGQSVRGAKPADREE